MLYNRYFKKMMFWESDDGTGAGGSGESSGAGADAAGTVVLPKSAEELTKLIQAETEKALQTSQEKWQKDFKTKLETEVSEAGRLAKLTADEREKELEKKKKEELDLRESTIKMQEITLKATDMLTEKGLPLDIRSLVIGKDEADTKARIEAFEGVFQKAIEAAVNQKLAGSAKPGAGAQPKSELDALMAEIEAGLNR